MLTGGFLRQKWPKVHEHLVEECEALHVNDVLRTFQPSELASEWEWTIPGPLTVRLVARRGGPFKGWWIICPRCTRRRDALYLPQAGSRWACRECHDLIYASQRHGFRHPLRQVLTHRKRISLQREVLRQARWSARIRARQDDRPVSEEVVADLERVIADVRAFGESLKREREEATRRREEAARQIEAELASQVAPTLERLRHLAASVKRKRNRERARRILDGYRRGVARSERTAPRFLPPVD